MNQYKNVILENVPCCMGCEPCDKILFTAKDILNDLPGEFNVVKCIKCNLMRTNPRPNPESIGFYYPEDYGPYKSTVVQSYEKINLKFFIKKALMPLISRIFQFNGEVIPKLTPGNLLEIGCASGSFLHKMSEKGWNVQGIEFDLKAGLLARKLGFIVHIGLLDEAPNPIDKFDLITGWMVLEHLQNPLASLKKLNEWAKPEAYLAISIPNSGSFEFNLFKGNGYALQLPTHLYHFTPQTIEELLQLSGWKIDKIYHQRTLSNIIGSIGYVLLRKRYIKLGTWCKNFPEKGGIFVYLIFPLSWVLSIFGQTGRMTVIARKKFKLSN